MGVRPTQNYGVSHRAGRDLVGWADAREPGLRRIYRDQGYAAARCGKNQAVRVLDSRVRKAHEKRIRDLRAKNPK